MTEYQYYEFLAVERVLTDREMAELRAISPRAEITPTRFASEAGFSQFRGDPCALMTWYFDVMVHVTSWGTRRFMLRLPAALVDSAGLRPCFAGQSASLQMPDLRWGPGHVPGNDPDIPYLNGNATKPADRGSHCVQFLGDPARRADGGARVAPASPPSAPRIAAGHQAFDEVVVLDFQSESDDPEDWQDGAGWMASLAPLRADLIRGDMRAPYLGWLLCAQRGEVEEGALEPAVPPGLGRLTEPLERLVAFLRIDEHLLAAAATRSARRSGHIGLAGWVAALSRREKNDLLVEVARGRETHVGARLLKRFRSSQAVVHPENEAPPARTAGHLLEEARRRAHEQQREHARRAADARARRETEQAAGRTKHLDGLADRQEAAWDDIEGLIAVKQAMTYDLAVMLITDLRDVAIRAGTQSLFEARLAVLRDRHRGKSSFLERLEKAGLEARREERAS